MAITQTIDLNLIPDSEPVIVHVDQYDTGTGRIRATLYNGDQTYTPSQATAVIQGTKPDGHGFIYEATINGSVVTANLTEQMTACEGNVRTQIVVTESNGRTGTFCFTLAVQKSALPADTDMSASDYQLVQEMIEAAYAASTHTPYIGENGNWWVWNISLNRYVDTGVDASITVNIADITMLAPDATPYVTNTGTNTDPIFHLFIPRGKGISSISKTATSGLRDTYTITYSDGATYTYYVTNGNGITSVTKTSTSGLVDTYTITYDNGTTSTYTITNGKTAYQAAVDGGYTGTEAQFNSDLANFEHWAQVASTKASEASASATTASTKASEASASATTASTKAGEASTSESNAAASAASASTSKSDAEAYAVGKRNGVDVDSSDVTYHNNAKYYSGQSALNATASATSAGNAARSATSAGTSATNASASATAAASSASNANNSAGDAYTYSNNASDYADMSKSYAVGTNGVTRAGDATDNSKYYSEQAAGAVASANAVLDDVVDAGTDALTAIQNALDNDAPEFEIDFTTGHLMYGGTRFVFQINDNTGHLMWGLAV